MPVYLGVDFHARTQTVCWCATADGTTGERTLHHQLDDVRAFYAPFPAPAVVGLESSGYARWFHRWLDQLGHQVRVGDAYALRQLARRRQKNDRRDAALLLELLLRDEFPAVHLPSPARQDVPGAWPPTADSTLRSSPAEARPGREICRSSSAGGRWRKGIISARPEGALGRKGRKTLDYRESWQ